MLLCESIGPDVLLACFILCLALLVPFPHLLLSFCSLGITDLVTFHTSVSWWVGARSLYPRKGFCDFNCGCNRNQSRSVLCSRYTKDWIPLRVTPFLETFSLCVKRNIIFPCAGDLGGGLSVQWTLGLPFLPTDQAHGSFAVPGWGHWECSCTLGPDTADILFFCF